MALGNLRHHSCGNVAVVQFGGNGWPPRFTENRAQHLKHHQASQVGAEREHVFVARHYRALWAT